MLESMAKKARYLCGEAIRHVESNDVDYRQTSLKPLIGFHTSPSLQPLHLHCVPNGLISGQFVKSQKHVSSYLTDKFLDIDDVVSFMREGILTNATVKISRSDSSSDDDGGLKCFYVCSGNRLGCAFKCGKGVGGGMKAWETHQETCEFIWGDMGSCKGMKRKARLVWEGTEGYFRGVVGGGKRGKGLA